MPWVAALLHPSAIMRGRWSEAPAQEVYVRRAVSIARGEPFTVPDVSQPPPGSLLRPTLKTLADFDAEIPKWTHMAVDIENAGHFITLLGLTLFDMERVGPTLSLPFRTQHGLDYWVTWQEHLEAVGYLYRWLQSPLVKVFHNGVSHDVPMLEETGFVVSDPIDDTMVAAHWSYPEFRKGLQYLATLYCGFGVWKTLLDESDEVDGKS